MKSVTSLIMNGWPASRHVPVIARLYHNSWVGYTGYSYLQRKQSRDPNITVKRNDEKDLQAHAYWHGKKSETSSRCVVLARHEWCSETWYLPVQPELFTGQEPGSYYFHMRSLIALIKKIIGLDLFELKV